MYTYIRQSSGLKNETLCGGLAIVFRDELKVRSQLLANSLKVTSCELQLVKLSSRSTSFVIQNIYRPPSNCVHFY